MSGAEARIGRHTARQSLRAQASQGFEEARKRTMRCHAVRRKLPKPAGRTHNDLRVAAKQPTLFLDGHATDEAANANASGRDGDEVSSHLVCQLACRCDDQGEWRTHRLFCALRSCGHATGLVVGLARFALMRGGCGLGSRIRSPRTLVSLLEQPLQDGQTECERLARASLRSAHNVAPAVKRRGQAHALDGCGVDETFGSKRGDELLVQAIWPPALACGRDLGAGVCAHRLRLLFLLLHFLRLVLVLVLVLVVLSLLFLLVFLVCVLLWHYGLPLLAL